MFRDPLYRQIRRGLRELKDGDTFESLKGFDRTFAQGLADARLGWAGVQSIV